MKIHITTGDYFYIVEDLIHGLIHALKNDGCYKVTFGFNTLDKDAWNINIASTGLSLEQFKEVENKLIHYNLEQINQENYHGTSANHLATLRIGKVWDYSQQNIDNLKIYGINAVYVPIGYTPEMTFIDSSGKQDIDVLFYGYETERRINTLNKIRELGLNVVTSNILNPTDQPWSNFYRDQLISRSKVVLNMHAYDTNTVFEFVRVSHLLANKKAVVSEGSGIPGHLEKTVLAGDLEELPSFCKLLARDIQLRDLQEKRGFNIFSRYPYINNINNAL